MTALMVRITRRRIVGALAIAVPLAVCVGLLAWRGIADPMDGVALGALGVGVLLVAGEFRRLLAPAGPDRSSTAERR